jgi:phosphatidylinositol-3-phosphatase
MAARAFRGLLLSTTMLLAFATVSPQASGSSGPVPSFGHVFVIIGENTELIQINSRSMPYLTGRLRQQSAWLTDYWAVTHFSAANYIAMTSGQYTPCEQFDYPPSRCHQDVQNLFHELDGVGASWTAWNESMPELCYLTNAGSSKTLNHYAVKHNPAVYYADVEGAGGVWSATDRSAECLSNVLPTGGTGPNDMSAFNEAVASGDVADFNYIVPNECEDAHDTCQPNPPAALGQFDEFLAREVPRILASPAFGDDGVLIVTFDEGTSTSGGGGSNGDAPCQPWGTCPNTFHGGGNVAFLVISPLAATGTYGGFANHFSLLRTLEDGFGTSTHAGEAEAADPITSIWT